ncbi:hypothetical protein ACSFBX_34745, partial [Variovorax sp. RB2P76]|uniref:hypothetical protein n=1 Tax=Variovorax sp. RB2P76 TaxID=3443736 RepID=UPI003F4773CE
MAVIDALKRVCGFGSDASCSLRIVSDRPCHLDADTASNAIDLVDGGPVVVELGDGLIKPLEQ